MPTIEEFRKCKDAKAVANWNGPLTDRNFFITGASSGLGLETALALAAAGGNVICACRSGPKSDAALSQIRSVATRGATVHMVPLDLASSASVRACATQFETQIRPSLPHGGTLHALILNAGIIGMSFGAFRSDMEPQIQVNLLGHALLFDQLQPVLEVSPETRVVVVSSGSHYWITGEELDINKELPPKKENYNSGHIFCLTLVQIFPFTLPLPLFYYPLLLLGHAYGFSNLCRILWAKALSKRVSYPVVSLHPACATGTDMGKNIGISTIMSILPRVLYHEFRGFIEGQSVSQGARTQTFVAVAPREIVSELNGKFISGNASDGPLGSPVKPSAFAQRDDYAEAVFQFVREFVEKEKQSS